MRTKADDLASPRYTSTGICETGCPITLVSPMLTRMLSQRMPRKVKLKKIIFKNPTLKLPVFWCYTGSLVTDLQVQAELQLQSQLEAQMHAASCSGKQASCSVAKKICFSTTRAPLSEHIKAAYVRKDKSGKIGP